MFNWLRDTFFGLVDSFSVLLTVFLAVMTVVLCFMSVVFAIGITLLIPLWLLSLISKMLFGVFLWLI